MRPISKQRNDKKYNESHKEQRYLHKVSHWRPYSVHRKDKCEICGFVPISVTQLDVHHIDGNHHNNEPTNLQTLCANCHRLVTWVEGNHRTAQEVFTPLLTYYEIAV
jgi:hypothetical protein